MKSNFEHSHIAMMITTIVMFIIMMRMRMMVTMSAAVISNSRLSLNVTDVTSGLLSSLSQPSC